MFTTDMLTVFPVMFRAGVSHGDLESNRQAYDKYRGHIDTCGQAKRARTDVEVDLYELFDKDLLSSYYGDVEGVTEKALLAMGTLPSAVG